ncbi:MAG: ferredoxin [Aeromicrobium sp.]|nr:ferredoxin [Aeromicrobium sp.]
MRGVTPGVHHTVLVEPAGHAIEVQDGESVIQAAWREGYDWPTLCYGMGTCTACQCEIVEGLDRVSPTTEAERSMLSGLANRRRRRDPRRVRLACQLRVVGNVVIRKPGVRLAEQKSAKQ